MLVVLNDEQIVSIKQICPNCLLANHQGLPRWQEGHLACAKALSWTDHHQLPLYECQMGFRLANLKQ